MKEAKNIDRLTDFALGSFGIANPIKKVCPICKKSYPINEFEGDICMTCYKREQELNEDYDDKSTIGEERPTVDDGEEDDGHDYEYEKWRDYREQNMPSN